MRSFSCQHCLPFKVCFSLNWQDEVDLPREVGAPGDTFLRIKMRGYIEVVRHLHAVRTGKNPCNKILIGCRSHGGSRWLQWNRGTRDDCEQQHAHSQSRPGRRMLPAFHQDVPSIHYSLLFYLPSAASMHSKKNSRQE